MAKTKVQLDDRFPKLVVELPIRAGEAEISTAAKIANEAKRRAPKLNRAIVYPTYWRYPGQMAESIHVVGVDDHKAVAVGAFWGLFVEQGTEFMEAEPFLLPAALSHEASLIGDVATSLKRLED